MWESSGWYYSFFSYGARSPSGKAKVCKTFIGGSIPPRASNLFLKQIVIVSAIL